MTDTFSEISNTGEEILNDSIAQTDKSFSNITTPDTSTLLKKEAKKMNPTSANLNVLKYEEEIEDLKLKLQTASDICVQQESHFSNLVKELELRLCEAISGRDELLTIRQHESSTQQQLIQQLQATLQQTKQGFEMKEKALNDFQNQSESYDEKMTQVQVLFGKIKDVLRNEEDKRGRTKTTLLYKTTDDQDNIFHFENGEVLLDVLSTLFKDDDLRTNEILLKCQQMEKELTDYKRSCEEEKKNLISKYESQLSAIEDDNGKALDIAACRTLAERQRIAEISLQMQENKEKYQQAIYDHEESMRNCEEEIKKLQSELEEKTKLFNIQHAKDMTVCEEQAKIISVLQKEKEDLLKTIMDIKTSTESTYVERNVFLEEQLRIALERNNDLGQKANEKENAFLEQISQLKSQLANEREEIHRLQNQLTTNHEIVCKEHDKEISNLKTQLNNKTSDCEKYEEEFKNMEEKLRNQKEENVVITSEKERMSNKYKQIEESFVHLKAEKYSLSTMIRDNVQDLNRARTVIDNLQHKLEEKQKSVELFKKQDSEIAELLIKKQIIVDESLIEERQQIVNILQEKIQEIEQLKEIRDTLAYKLETKIQVLEETQLNCRTLQTTLELRSNELQVLMEDRDQLIKEMKMNELELMKIKEERDSLLTLKNGKDSEKEQEINKLITRLKDTQQDLALTKKVLEAKREANNKAVKIASVGQEEITTKRKEIDALNDRIKWLQQSLQATTQEKALFENKATELQNELHITNEENNDLRHELDGFIKCYDEANSQINHMEKALEKAALKFTESQALVEKLEQDLAKIKLQHSLEVKNLQRKVKSTTEPNIPVVQPSQKINPPFTRDKISTAMEYDATRKRLNEEVEMTKGFRVLLTDLHELMKEIKSTSAMLKKRNSVVERSTSTSDTTIPTQQQVNNHRTTNPKGLTENVESSQIPVRHISTNAGISETQYTTPGTPQNKNAVVITKRKTSKVKRPLHSSSPKHGYSSGDEEYNSNHYVSDISDVDSEWIMKHNNKEDKRKKKEIGEKSRNSAMFSGSISDFSQYEDDVESLLMSKQQEKGNHRKAQKILDLLAVKGQELTIGNQKIAALIDQQHDGIQRCREVEQNMKKIFK